jgi:lysophospholipase L1-like esterase
VGRATRAGRSTDSRVTHFELADCTVSGMLRGIWTYYTAIIACIILFTVQGDGGVDILSASGSTATSPSSSLLLSALSFSNTHSTNNGAAGMEEAAVTEELLIDILKGRTILAYGDSLTHGYASPGGRVVHPYALKLTELLQTINTSSQVIPRGFNGITTNEMLHGEHKLVNQMHSLWDQTQFAAVIILGGTNDLARREGSAAEILANIIHLHRKVQFFAISTAKRPIYTIALTIPESGWGFNETARLGKRAETCCVRPTSKKRKRILKLSPSSWILYLYM